MENCELLNAILHNKVMSLSDLRPYLFKDENDDQYLLTDGLEIYLYWGYFPESIANARIRILCYNKLLKQALKKMNGSSFTKWIDAEDGSESLSWDLDDGIEIFETDIRNLPSILALRLREQHLHWSGKKLSDMESLLGHKIIPYHLSTAEKHDISARQRAALDHGRKRSKILEQVPANEARIDYFSEIVS